MKTPPKKVFITYSHKNATQRESLEVALAVMIQKKEIEIWSDVKILPGDKWEKKIKTKLEKSDILLYLVSPFSLASTNCNKELTDILSKNQNIEVIPIILEDCDFLQHPLAEFEALPTKNKEIKPISKWKPQSDGWQNVINGVRKTIKKLPSNTSTLEEPGTPPTPQGAPAPLNPIQAADFLFSRANFFLMLKNYDAAILFYTEALKLNPTVETYNNRGIAYSKKGDEGEFDKAIADFEKVINLNPNLPETYNNRGIAYSKKGDFDKAIANFERAIALNPNHMSAYINRGVIYNSIGNYDKAIANFNKAIELNPTSEAYNNLGNAYGKDNNHKEAIANYNKAIKLNPNNAEAYFNRGIAHNIIKKYEKAIADYDKSITLNPNASDVYIYCHRGLAKMALKKYKAAKEDLQFALKFAEQQGKKEFAADIQKEIATINRLNA